MNTEPFTIEQLYHSPVEKVWKAISNSDEMKKWYFDIPGFKPEVGFKFQFMGGPNENRQYLHLCKITEVEVNRKLVYSWRYDGYAGNTEVTFELFPEDGQTRLKLTHKGLETFPADNPDFSKENFTVGWIWIVGTALKEFLEN